VATLRDWSGSQNKSLADFRRKLRVALGELVRSGALAAWRIDDGDLVHVERTPTASRRPASAPPTRRCFWTAWPP